MSWMLPTKESNARPHIQSALLVLRSLNAFSIWLDSKQVKKGDSSRNTQVVEGVLVGRVGTQNRFETCSGT